MVYASLILALASAGAMQFQFLYLIFLRMFKHHDERRVRRLEVELHKTQREREIDRRRLLSAREKREAAPEVHPREEVWPEIVDG